MSQSSNTSWEISLAPFRNDPARRPMTVDNPFRFPSSAFSFYIFFFFFSAIAAMTVETIPMETSSFHPSKPAHRHTQESHTKNPLHAQVESLPSSPRPTHTPTRILAFFFFFFLFFALVFYVGGSVLVSVLVSVDLFSPLCLQSSSHPLTFHFFIIIFSFHVYAFVMNTMMHGPAYKISKRRRDVTC